MIRTVLPGDLGRIAAIYVDSWQRTYKGMLPEAHLRAMNPADAADKWKKYFDVPGQGAFVAVDENDKVEAFACFMPYAPEVRCLLLDSLHVLSALQGKGLGKALIGTVARYALENAYGSMAVCIVKANSKAGGIYEHLGARRHSDFIDQVNGMSIESKRYMWDDLQRLAAISQ